MLNFVRDVDLLIPELVISDHSWEHKRRHPDGGHEALADLHGTAGCRSVRCRIHTDNTVWHHHHHQEVPENTVIHTSDEAF